MLEVFRKEFKKLWLIGTLPPLLVTLFIPLIAGIWPELKEQAAIFEELLQNEIYKAMLGELGNVSFTTWQGAFFMYIFIWSEWVLLFITIVFPAYLITSEKDGNTLDIMLSFPIPRWRFILEKFGVYLSYNLLYPISLIVVTFVSTEFLQEEFNYEILLYATIGLWLLFFALGALSFLCAAIFLDTKRAIGASALLIMGQYILQRFFGLVESLKDLQNFSVFNYLNAGSLNNWYKVSFNVFIENFIPEVVIVSLIGIFALTAALFIFQRRELAY
jgi:ABC-type transport system involved in multi-copper enzyme maturation permease subunit